jgi:ABC-type branched-subunit amino acid transport system substrate-binding protein
MCWLAGFARHHMQSSPEGDKVASTGPQQGRRCTKHREEKSMKKTVMSLAAAASLLAGVSMAAAEPVKVGMITTLSGGGASLGIDVRDGFELALKQSGNKDVELIIEDDARKPDLAVQWPTS